MTQVRRGLLAALLKMGELGDPQGSLQAGQEGLEYRPREAWGWEERSPGPCGSGPCWLLWGPQGRPGVGVGGGGWASPGSCPPAACGQQRPLVAASMPLRVSAACCPSVGTAALCAGGPLLRPAPWGWGGRADPGSALQLFPGPRGRASMTGIQPAVWLPPAWSRCPEGWAC